MSASATTPLPGMLPRQSACPLAKSPVIAFLHAKDAELTAVRTILSGRRAGLDEAMIWERLRECYV